MVRDVDRYSDFYAVCFLATIPAKALGSSGLEYLRQKCKTLAVLSQLPVRIRLPSREKATGPISPLCLRAQVSRPVCASRPFIDLSKLHCALRILHLGKANFGIMRYPDNDPALFSAVTLMQSSTSPAAHNSKILCPRRDC